jgi:hypothetical protein
MGFSLECTLGYVGGPSPVQAISFRNNQSIRALLKQFELKLAL